MSLDSRRIKFLLCGSDYCQRCVQRAVCTACSVYRFESVCHVQCVRAGTYVHHGDAHDTTCTVPHVQCAACTVCITCNVNNTFYPPRAVCIPCSLYQCTSQNAQCGTCSTHNTHNAQRHKQCAPQALCMTCSDHYTQCLSCSLYAAHYEQYGQRTTQTHHLAPGEFASRAVCSACSAQHVQCTTCTICFTCSVTHVRRPPTSLWQCSAHHVQCAACTECITCNVGVRVLQCSRTST